MRFVASLCIILVLGHGHGALAQTAESSNSTVPSSETKQTETAEQVYKNHPMWSKALSLWATDYLSFASNLFNYSWTTYGLVAGTTLALAPYDQHIHDEANSLARRNHWINNKSQQRKVTAFSLFGAPQAIFLPSSGLGTMWYLGDGITWLVTAGSFAAYGYAHDNTRSTQVAFQILESLAIVGPTVLAIKMATGREAPSESTEPGGAWHGFPGLKTYSRNQARYYSYPSGHVSSAVSALVVISENYPEEPWLVPCEGVMVGLLMFALMNVGSHWPSDFPLAIMLGYTSGKTVVVNSKARQKLALHPQYRNAWVWEGITPIVDAEEMGLRTNWHF